MLKSKEYIEEINKYLSILPSDDSGQDHHTLVYVSS
jgi:hypothetical protein